MKTTLLGAMLLVGIGWSACNNAGKATANTGKIDNSVNQSTKNMKNFISIVEIPVTNLSRATAFYQTILGITIEAMEMDGVHMGVFPNDEGTVNVVLAHGNDYKPTADGAVLYLNAGNDLQPALDKVAQNGGKILVPKTQISPEMGYFAMFTDTEGNKMGLHSIR